jgi:hypothetical protein
MIKHVHLQSKHLNTVMLDRAGCSCGRPVRVSLFCLRAAKQTLWLALHVASHPAGARHAAPVARQYSTNMQRNNRGSSDLLCCRAAQKDRAVLGVVFRERILLVCGGLEALVLILSQ